MQIFIIFFQMKYLGKPLNFWVHLPPVISSLGQASQNWIPDSILMLAKKGLEMNSRGEKKKNS